MPGVWRGCSADARLSSTDKDARRRDAGTNSLGVRIAFCYDPKIVRSSNLVLVAQLRDLGVEVVEIDSLAAAIERPLAGYDVCVPRHMYGYETLWALSDAFSAVGVPVLNEGAARHVAQNKAVAHLLFDQQQLPQLPWASVDAVSGVDVEPGWQGATLIKPMYGYKGQGIESFADPEQALARAVERKENLVLQPLLEGARSWRVIVGREAGAVSCYWKEPAPGEIIASVARGATRRHGETPEPLLYLAEQMLAALDADLLGVDILERDGQLWALEANHNFAFPSEDRAIAHAVLTECRRLASSSGIRGELAAY